MPWGSWEVLGAHAQGVQAVSGAAGSLDVLVQGATGGLCQLSYRNGAWSGYTTFSTPAFVQSTPAVLAHSNGRIDVIQARLFPADDQVNDSGLYYTWYQDYWRPWQNLGTGPSSGMALVAPASGQLGVLGSGFGSAAGALELGVKTRDGDGWHPWKQISDVFGDCAAISSPSGRIDVVFNNGGALFHLWSENGVWHPKEPLNLTDVNDFDVVSARSGTLDVIARTKAGNPFRVHFDGAWSQPENLGGVFSVITSTLAVVSSEPGRLDVFVTKDSQLLQNSHTGTWTGWQPVPVAANVALVETAVASWGPGRIDVFAHTMSTTSAPGHAPTHLLQHLTFQA
jgi:hypothetical protein